YPGALGIDLSAEKGDFQAITKKIEEVIVEKGAAGRLGTWVYSFGYTTTVGLGELAKRIIDGNATISLSDLIASYEKFTPGASWNCGYYVDLNTGIEKKNHMLVYQDTYVFGKGYLEMTKVEIPEKYLTIK
ncbi:MAG TPA: DUF3798 domain-containing protein, partial [Acetomicrobium sp.]